MNAVDRAYSKKHPTQRKAAIVALVLLAAIPAFLFLRVILTAAWVAGPGAN